MLRQVELLQVRADRLCRKALRTQVRDRRVPVPLGELAPVGAEHEPVVDHLRQLATDGSGDPAVELEVRAVVRAADDMCDPELEVVDDRGELVGGRAVRTQQRRAAAAEPNGALVVALGRSRPERALGRSRVERHRARSAAAAPRRTRHRATRGRRGSPPPRPRPCASGRCRRSGGRGRPLGRPRSSCSRPRSARCRRGATR